jgi:hypothetical protein
VLAVLFRRADSARYHVFKHVLHRSEGWRRYYEPGLDTEAARKRLHRLKCKGKEHGDGCPSNKECDKELDKLVPTYLRLIEEAFQEGARVPRHMHEGNGEIRPSIFFLSAKGVIAQAWDYGDTLELRTAYRTRLNGVASESEAEYHRDAKEYILHRADVASVHFSLAFTPLGARNVTVGPQVSP